MGYCQLTDDGLRLHCQIQPKASRDAIVGIHNERLKIQITAPPTDGKANEHLVRFIAKTLGIAKSRVVLVAGDTSRQKTLLLQGIDHLPDSFPAVDGQ